MRHFGKAFPETYPSQGQIPPFGFFRDGEAHKFNSFIPVVHIDTGVTLLPGDLGDLVGVPFQHPVENRLNVSLKGKLSQGHFEKAVSIMIISP